MRKLKFFNKFPPNRFLYGLRRKDQKKLLRPGPRLALFLLIVFLVIIIQYFVYRPSMLDSIVFPKTAPIAWSAISFPADELPIMEKEYRRIERFCRYMDSLSRSEPGKHLHDSIMSKRPGLLDSAKLILLHYKNRYHDF